MHNIMLSSRMLLVPRRVYILNEEETCRKRSVNGVIVTWRVMANRSTRYWESRCNVAI